MDVLTHGFAPYAVATFLRLSRRQRMAAAIGGFAPDMDTLFAWLASMRASLYPLTHRGFSHTLWGAPLLATVFWFLLSRPAFRARWQRWASFEWAPDTLIPLWLGAWSHLVLDGLTITGVPLLWPYDVLTRYTANWFFYSVLILIPVSLFAWIQIMRRKATDHFIQTSLLVVAVGLILTGIVRFGTHPHVPDGAFITPGTSDWEWTVSERNDTGVAVTGYSLGRPVATHFFPEANRSRAEAAHERCRDLPAYVAWHWNLWGTSVVNGTQDADGSWNLTFFDSAREYLRQQGTFRLAGDRDEPERARCLVAPDGSARFQRPRGWLGG